ncbi:MAG: hypothetical protein OEM02_00110 [Desulfobulbaceae bacterium]|nr:hypothetical protein [Desulfobulbaceae bacterium]
MSTPHVSLASRRSFTDNFYRFKQLAFILGATLLVTACGPSVSNVRFKVNSAPEGAHLIYRVSDQELKKASDWIYLGNTPFQGVRRIKEEEMKESSKVTLKVMRAGYFDQVKEWDGQSFLEEAEGRGQILWTPRLISQ